MARKRVRPGEISRKLREAEVELAQGKKASEVCKKLGVTEQTYYRWRKGGRPAVARRSRVA
jgi:putative transposase